MHGCRHGIAVVNGTVSLRIALLAAGIRAEDEVIVPPYTFVSTASAVVEANAIPVFADIDLDTFNLDPAAVEAAITPRTRAIIPVHFAGQPADMDAIMAHRAGARLVVIEDAAHAHGATYRDRPAGSLGHLASFSFQSSKNLTSGEGGIITTNDDALAEACRSIHNCGRVPDGIWYEHHVDLRQLPARRIPGRPAQLPARSAGGTDRDARRATAGIWRPASPALPGLHPQTRPRRMHAAQLSPVHAADRRGRVRRAARRGARRARRPKASRAPPATASRCPTSRCSATRRSVRICPGASAAAGLRASRAARTAISSAASSASGSDRTCCSDPREDMDDIARAFEKVYEHREALTHRRRALR